MLALFFILSAFLVVNGFRSMPFSRRAFKFQLAAEIEVGSVSEIPNGERKIVDTEAGSVIVANVDEKFYAMNAKCPHLGIQLFLGFVNVSLQFLHCCQYSSLSSFCAFIRSSYEERQNWKRYQRKAYHNLQFPQQQVLHGRWFLHCLVYRRAWST